ncbi:MAG TPA: thioredoxin domain-containing protein [Myxococcales bacterium]|nr:thioredoxin domain-containing protein [Myxococcales bacterium]
MGIYRCALCEGFGSGAKCGCGAKLDHSGGPQPVDHPGLLRAIERSPVPVFVDFWAPWCGPCNISAPAVKALAASMAGDLIVLALDTQAAPVAGEVHAIYAIPTFALFARGEEVARRVGLLPGGEMERWVRSLAAEVRG